MSTKYLVYEPAGDPKFHIPDPQFTSDEDGLSQLTQNASRFYRLIKITGYDEANPGSGIMSIVPVSSEASSASSGSSDPDSVPIPPPITSSPLYEFGIASPSKEEEEQIRRYNLNIFNVMEFTENYGGRQSESNQYYREALDAVKQSLTTSEYTKVNDKTSREDYIIHNNRVIEYAIVYIRTMNNYKYIDTDDIQQILVNLNYIHDHLDKIYEKIGPYINKKLGRTSYDNAVIKLKVAVAYYLLAEYKDADKIFETIDLNEVPSNGLLYMYIKYYHALVKQVQLDFLESDRLIEDVIKHNEDLVTNSPNMYARCMMVFADNALYLYNKDKAINFYKDIIKVSFTAIKANDPNEQEFYDTMPEIMNNLVKSRYATVRYYVGDDKPIFAELQGIVSTFRKHLPAFHPYTVDAQVTLLLTNFASKPTVNQSTLIDLMERMYIVNWNVYPMKFLHYMSLYSLVKPQVSPNKKINVYDIIVNEYIKQIVADKTEFVSNNTNESVLVASITTKVTEVIAKKDEIKSYFTTTNIPAEGLRNQTDGGFHELPALFIFDYLKTILMNTSEEADKTRDALKTRFQEAILDRIPEQKDSLKVAVKNPIDTTGLPDKESYLFKAVLYEVIGGDDKELLNMATEKILNSKMVDGESVEVELITKPDLTKKSIFKKTPKIPDFVKITIKKDGASDIIKNLRKNNIFELPDYTQKLKVDDFIQDIKGEFIGIRYFIGNSTTQKSTLNVPKNHDTDKRWMYVSKTVTTVPSPIVVVGGTRSKRRTPLERKTRKVRSGLSVKMEE